MPTNERTLDRIGDVLVEAGLTTPAHLTRARAARGERNSSVALNLVLQGGVEAEALADMLCETCGLRRATEVELRNVRGDVVSAVPFDLVYDLGVLPLGYDAAGHLVVGVIDPTEASGLDEAQFYSGMEFVLRVVSVAEFVRGFEAATGQPWKVSSEELAAVQRRLGESMRRLDADLEELFSEAPNATGSPKATTGVVVELAASNDSVVELQTPVRPGARKADLEVVPVAAADSDLPVVELPPVGAPPPRAATVAQLPIRQRSGSASVEVDRRAGAGLDDPTGTLPAAGLVVEIDAVVDDDEVLDLVQPRAPGRAVDSVQMRIDPSPRHIGGETPAVMPTVSATRNGLAAGRGAGGSMSGGARVLELGPEEAASPKVREGSGRVLRHTAQRVPTVGEYLGAEHDGVFAAVSDLVSELGPVTPATRAAFRLLEAGLGTASTRDGVARQLVETLSIVYPTVVVLSLRLPRAMVWDAALSTGGEPPVGQLFDIAEGSLWHRLSSGPGGFLGRIPVGDPLFRLVPRALEGEVLALPLRLGDRPVGVLLVDSGGAGELANPGEDIERVSGWVDAALKRVIVRRKGADRSV